jgi:aryl-alcohol dehydrogenase-like predicted oxidoreductase
MQQRQIGPFQVTAIGLGCMNLSHAYGVPPPPEQGERVLLAALDAGVTLFDTAALYGFGANETLVGNVLSKHRSKFTLASKGGVAGVKFDDGVKRVIDGRPQTLRQNCEDSLRRLRTEVIDLYYLHRWDKKVPIEDSVGAMSDLVRAGKVRSIGLSEVSAKTIRKAHAVHPISAVQTEYSLWTRDVEREILPTLRELGIALVAYSPLGRGFLSGRFSSQDELEDGDYRRHGPRFTGENLQKNCVLAERVRELAAERGITPGQLALAWVLSRGEHIVPIPGTKRVSYLEENLAAAEVRLSEADAQAIADALPPAAGERYPEAVMRSVNL